MIRAAKHTDAPAIEGLIRRQHAASKYAGIVGIADKALDSLLLGLIAQQGQYGPQGTHVAVAMRDSKVVGFIAGVLQRVYQIGDKLEAMDLFFVNEGTIGDTFGLIDSYIGWTSGNRKVLEAKLSWTDTIPGAEKIAKLFERKGLTKCGEVYSMRLHEPVQEQAA